MPAAARETCRHRPRRALDLTSRDPVLGWSPRLSERAAGVRGRSAVAMHLGVAGAMFGTLGGLQGGGGSELEAISVSLVSSTALDAREVRAETPTVDGGPHRSPSGGAVVGAAPVPLARLPRQLRRLAAAAGPRRAAPCRRKHECRQWPTPRRWPRCPADVGLRRYRRWQSRPATAGAESRLPYLRSRGPGRSTGRPALEATAAAEKQWRSQSRHCPGLRPPGRGASWLPDGAQLSSSLRSGRWTAASGTVRIGFSDRPQRQCVAAADRPHQWQRALDQRR